MGKPSMIQLSRQAIKNDPKEIFNWYLIFCTCVWSFSGVAKGFDEGNIASAVVMNIFRQMYHIDNESADQYADTKGWIVSIATAGAVFGCLGCMSLNNVFGRKKIMIIGTIIYMAGIFGQTFSPGNLGALYASRVIAGMGIGVTTILPSVYISEIAPKSIRGLLTLQYAACQQLGVVLGFFINYGVTRSYANTYLQYQLPTALQLLPAAVWGIGICFTPESPRYLLSKNLESQAMATLSRFRNLPPDHPYVQEEYLGILAQVNREVESVAGSSWWDLTQETFGPVSNRRRFFLMFMCHLFSQWSGANAITQYSPTILSYLGIAAEESRFLTTGIYAVVKFVSTLLVALFVIDFIGRRRSLITGITLQILTLTFIGAYLGVSNGLSPAQIEADDNLRRCSVAAIVAMFIHAVAWSIGWFSIPYLVSSEVFPVRIRSFNVSILTALHWAFYFSCSRAMPSLLVATHRFGAFALFASICTLSLGFVYFAMPETMGRSLESMDALFQRPWYTVHKVAYPTVADLNPDVARASGVIVDDEFGSSQDVMEHKDTKKAAVS